MNTKEYHFDLLECWLFSFNKYWEKPLGPTRLREEPYEATEELISYCTLIKTHLRKYKLEKMDYTKYPDSIQKLIQSVLDVVTDGRELHKEVEFEGRKYNHHCQENGYLSFENDPLDYCDQVIEECKKIQIVLQSEENTKDLSGFIGKTIEFENYEDGSAVIYIKKINEVNGKFSFDGYIVSFETVNGRTDGDGILIREVEDRMFSDIPCAYLEDPETSKELKEILESGKETTLEEVKKFAIKNIELLFEQDLGI